jgi:hypothetical protein
MGEFSLVNHLRDIVGDDVRMVLVYGEREYEDTFLRDDISEEYTEADLEGLRREIIVFSLGKTRVGDVTHVGELRHIIYDTEDALSIQLLLGEHEGVFVSVDDEREAELFDVIEATRAWIDEQ